MTAPPYLHQVQSTARMILEIASLKSEGDVNPSRFPRKIEPVIAYGFEIPVIRMANLSLRTAESYLCVLAGKNITGPFEYKDRRLYGLLCIGPPTNIIFIDQNLPVHLENYVLAHELGHFFIDILSIKNLWLHKLPELHEAIHRAFNWQTYDDYMELKAAIKGLPEKPTPIIARGKKRTADTSQREITADMVARELLAPWDIVAAEFVSQKEAMIRHLHSRYGLPKRVAYFYFDELDRELNPPPNTIERLFSAFED